MTRYSETRDLRRRLAMAGTANLRDAGPPPQWLFRAPLAALSDCLAAYRIKDDGSAARHLIDIFEPLDTKAPSPALAHPYCCYLRSIIFYHEPVIVSPWRKLWRGAGERVHANPTPGHFEEWDKIDARLAPDDLVAFEGDIFEVSSGRVFWAARPGDSLGRRWWMQHGARRRSS